MFNDAYYQKPTMCAVMFSGSKYSVKKQMNDFLEKEDISVVSIEQDACCEQGKTQHSILLLYK